jgi:serine/threonine-protein kinase
VATPHPNPIDSQASELTAAGTAATPSPALDPLDQLGDPGDDAELIGQVVAERYRIVELLGRGGMGAVYRADHVLIHKSFALKVLHRELTHHAEAVKRFEREAIAAGRIDHPNVATATDFGRLASGAFFLVLDYVQGISLRQLLRTERTLPEQRALRIARQIAAGLGAAHAAGVVHRDLKPDNVMLLEASADTDHVKVLDFGIAKIRSDELRDEPAITRFGTVFGTPEYMSPEQAVGQAVDLRSDLYALGILLYEMLAGKTPFFDEQLVAILARQMTEAPPELPSSVTQATRDLVMRLLEKQPESRPQSAELVVAEIDAIAASSASQELPHREVQPDAVADLAMGSTLLDARQGMHASTATEHVAQAVGARASPAARSATRSTSIPPWLRRSVTISGRRVPWVFIAMAVTLAISFAVGGFGIWALLRRPGKDESNQASGPLLSALIGESAERKQLRAWMQAATRGDVEALAKLEARSDSLRSAEEWAAIAAGRAQLRQWPAAVAAYDAALRRDPALGSNARTRNDLFSAALDTQASQSALEVAAHRLGPTGADLIYAVIEASLLGRAPKLDRKAARALLDSGVVAPHLSRALALVLRLESARACADFKALLPDVERSGDQRSLRILRKLTHDRGCGLLGLQDCYTCLRGGRALSAALDAAKSRPAPSFGATAGDGH